METSKGELVPGGLAMVYGLVNDTQQNGNIVNLVRLAAPEEVAENAWEPGDWLCEETGDDISVFATRNLMPINPEADPLVVEEEQCQTA